MTHQADLVFDVGMHDGSDTAYYLHKGYRVVAVEANPALIPPARKRFAQALASGRLCIANVGIAAHRGTADLYVSSAHDVIGSFSEASAARFGGNLTPVRVSCVPFREMIESHGVPYYLKVDIEGNDRLCIEGLTAGGLPPYLSIEMDHVAGDGDIRRLHGLGYQRFKCVRQNDFTLIDPGNIARQIELRRTRARGGMRSLAARALARWRKTLRRPRDGDWVFAPGSSGPFAKDLPGQWLTVTEILGVWQRLHDIDVELHGGGLGEWFDIHAALRDHDRR